MTDKTPKLKRPLHKRILRVLFISIMILFLLLVTIVLLIQTAPVQNMIRGKAVSYLQHKLHTKVEVGKIYIGFPKNIVIENVFFEDQQHDTLFSAGKLSVNISMFKLLHSEVEINDVKLQRATVKIKRLLPDTLFNFQFIVNAFSSPSKTTAKTNDTSSAKISIEDIMLDNIRAVYDDAVTGNDVDVFLSHLDINIHRFDLKNQSYEVPDINISGLHGKFYQNEPLVKSVAANASLNSPSPQFRFKNISLKNIQLDYKNNPGAIYTELNVAELAVVANVFDIDKKIISLDKIKLSGTTASVNLGKTAKGKEEKNDKANKSADSSNWRIAVKELLLDENNLGFDNDNVPKQKYGMDYAHIKSTGTSLYISNFLYSDDSIAGNISKGTLSEQSGFRLQALQGEFLYTNKEAHIKNLKLQTPGTLLQRSLVVYYPSIEALKKNIGLLLLDVDLRNSKVQVKDILTFVPSLNTQAILKDPNAVFLMNAKMKGSIADLKIEQLQFSGLQNTKIDASGYIKGLPDIKSLQANLAIKTISSSRRDILLFVPENKLPSNIAIPEQFDMNGQVNGGMNNLFADLVLNSSSGKASIKGNFKNLNDTKNIGYDATIATQNLNLGYILKDDSTYGNITLQLKAAGKGLDPKTANATIDATIQSAVYKKYSYQNASIKASVANQLAKADISMHDPNIYFSLNGSADLSTKYPAIKISSTIDSIKTKALHFTTDDIAYHGTINADFPDSDPDHLKGELVIRNSLLVKSGQKIKLDTIKVSAGETDSGQYLRLYADVINAQLQGRYRLTEMGTVFQQLTEPYFSVVHDSNLVKTQPYDFSVTVNIHNSPIFKELMPTLERLDPVGFQGHFTSANGWDANLNSPLIIYGDSRIQNLQLHAKPEAKKLVIQTTLQQFTSGKNFAFYNTSLDASIANNKIDFALNLQDKSAKDKYHLAGLVQKEGSDEYRFSLKPEKLLLNYEKWAIAENNEIHYSPSQISASHFNLKKGAEELNINTASNEKGAPLEISFNKFLLSTITGFAGTDSLLANGELNGKVIVKNLEAKPTFTSDLKIKDLSVYRDTVGDIALKVSNTDENKFSAEVNITGHGNDVALNGNYFVKPDNSSFDLNLDIRKLQLASVVGISTGALKNASGSVSGKFAVSGTLDKPDINGNLAFDKAAITPAMLNSYFFVDGQKFEVDNEGFNFDNFTILDSAKNKLVLDGNVKTSDYKHYGFDLSVAARNFQALNSTKRDNKLYYGQLFFNTNLNIKGTELQPSVDGTLRITNKTKLTVVLPQEEPGVEEREGVIRFVDMKSGQRDSILNLGYDSIGKSALRGFDIATNIIIDSSAELTLVVDENNGDHLTAKGTATLTGGVDRSGNVTLSGTYQLTHGSYDLTFSVLHKKFEIQNGSTITWTGEPTKATLNINAIYTSVTAPIDLVKNQLSQTVSNTNNYLQKLPFYVYLKMKGELLKPDISFDIVLPEDKAHSVSKEVVSTVQSKLLLIRQDQGEMNKQVFALLLLNRFVGEDPFASNAVGPNAESLVRQSVSKILSQQLNQLASNLVHGVDINFDLQSTDDYTTGQLQNRTDLNVSVSKQLLNDRLRVTVGSNFELEGPQNVNANQQSNNIAGNIAVDYKLSKDGKYLLRAYRRNDYDDVVEGYVIETGIGFIITIDYNHFKEIFESKKKKQKAVQKDQGVSGGGKND